MVQSGVDPQISILVWPVFDPPLAWVVWSASWMLDTLRTICDPPHAKTRRSHCPTSYYRTCLTCAPLAWSSQEFDWRLNQGSSDHFILAKFVGFLTHHMAIVTIPLLVSYLGTFTLTFPFLNSTPVEVLPYLKARRWAVKLSRFRLHYVSHVVNPVWLGLGYFDRIGNLLKNTECLKIVGGLSIWGSDRVLGISLGTICLLKGHSRVAYRKYAWLTHAGRQVLSTLAVHNKWWTNLN